MFSDRVKSHNSRTSYSVNNNERGPKRVAIEGDHTGLKDHCKWGLTGLMCDNRAGPF